jgi:prolyl-tRNA synthetase
VRDELATAGVRVELDDKVATGFGRRATDWELKGVPVRIEVGPRDLANQQVTLVRRDTGSKEPVAVGGVAGQIPALLERIQAELLAGATAARDARIADVTSLEDAVEASATGWARIPWTTIRGDGEARHAQDAVSVRCLQRPDGSVPDTDDDPDAIAYVGRAY